MLCSCVNAGCWCCPASSVSLSCGMGDSHHLGAGGDSPSPPGLLTARPAHKHLPWLTRWPQCHPCPPGSLLRFCSASGSAGLLLPAFNWLLMPGKDGRVRESSSFHLIPHEKGLRHNEVLNGVREAIDPARKRASFLRICKQDRTSDTH